MSTLLELGESSCPVPLAEWANDAELLSNPLDRPWFLTSAQPPYSRLNVVEALCRCKNKIELNRHDTNDPSQKLYLGQCENCERIVYTYAANKSNI